MAATRVLVVEDNPVTRKVLRVTLETGGYEVRETSDGRSALEALDSFVPDLVILDYALPDMNGDELCTTIHRLPAARELPVVLLSGLVSKAREHDRWFAASLLKPASPARVLEVVESVLAKSPRVRVREQEPANIHAAALSMMGAIAELLARPGETTATVGELLVHCLDAFGVSGGALYLRGADGVLRFHSLAGLTGAAREAAQRSFDVPHLLEPPHNAPATVTDRSAHPDEQRFLQGLGYSAALVIPLVILGRHVGTLVLASDRQKLEAPEWLTFARTLASQFAQVIALGRALADAKGSEDLIRQAIDAAPNGFLMVDGAGLIVLANPVVERIFGYSAAELHGCPVDTLVPESLRSTHAAKRVEYAKAPAKRQMGAGRELFGRHRSGRKVPLEVGLAPVIRGEQQYVIASIIDITERKQMQDALSDARLRLEALSGRLLEIQETERRELARELHDEVGQALTAVQINLQSIQRFEDVAGVPDRLRDASTIVDRALSQVRSLSLQLRPPLIDELGLVPALRWLVERLARASDVRFTITADALPTRPAPQVEITCFRIAQEALSNIVRHANAKTAHVELSSTGTTLELRVRDAGSGFDVQEAIARAARGTSLGLVGMEERARLAGGTIRWTSTPGKGTEVRATFPLTAA